MLSVCAHASDFHTRASVRARACLRTAAVVRSLLVRFNCQTASVARDFAHASVPHLHIAVWRMRRARPCDGCRGQTCTLLNTWKSAATASVSGAFNRFKQCACSAAHRSLALRSTNRHSQLTQQRRSLATTTRRRGSASATRALQSLRVHPPTPITVALVVLDSLALRGERRLAGPGPAVCQLGDSSQ